MTSIREAFLSVATQNNCPVMEQQGHMRVEVLGKHGTWPGFALCVEEEKLFLFYSVLNSLVSPERMHAAAELVARINYRLKLGAFELDFDSGELSFRTSMNLTFETKDVEEVIQFLVWGNAATMDKYFPAIMKVLYSNADPKAVLEWTDEENAAEN